MTDKPNHGTYLQTNGEPTIYVESQQESKGSCLTRLLWQGKLPQAFWTVTGIISIVVNVILVVVVIVIAQYLFTLNEIVEDGLIGGLHSNFVAMVV